MIGNTNSVVQLSRYDGHLTRRFYRAVELLTDIRQGDQKSRQAREARNKGDYGFDVYDPTAPPELQHRYVPANPEVINRLASDRAVPDRAVEEHAVPNRAARVSKRYPTTPQDHTETSGPETSQDPAPTAHRVRTSHSAPTTTPVTNPAKAPPPLR